MFLKKILIKILFPNKYRSFKEKEGTKKTRDIFKTKYEPYINEVQKLINNKKDLNFLHSGHSGDIINILPVIKELSKNHSCNLFIKTNKKITTNYENHPGKEFYINKKIFIMLEPLLKFQSYIRDVKEFDGQNIDINFDIFRELPINISFDNLRYASQITGVQPDFDKKYIDVPKKSEFKDKIVIQRTFRYRNQFINYKFIDKFENILFIGLKKEYEDLRLEIPNLKFYDCKDFLEMATIINSSKFFIGNSSLGFPIAEALKVPRLLEACPYFPAAQPHGKNAYDFYYQTHFEKFFKILLNIKN
ncbi:hypothetical protein OAM71_01125 [Pelagibacteraceae bacterium]|nr:hypothetical protein [Pelagibacteraceae bacterium]